MKGFKAIFLLVIVISCIDFSASASQPATPTNSINLPLVFEQNRGQAPSSVRFVARAPEATLFFEQGSVLFVRNDAGKSTTFHMRLSGGNRSSEISAEDATGGVANYYSGADRSKWVEGAPLYRRVRYSAVYRGIDMLFHDRGGRLEFDFEVQPKTDASAIELEFPGDQAISARADGSLAVTTKGETYLLRSPEAYQETAGKRDAVAVRYHLADAHHVKFELGTYDRDKALVIDPVVEYTWLIGLGNSVELNGIAVDNSGSLFMTGGTTAMNYPNTTGNPANVQTGSAVFITKLDPSGTSIDYSTLLTAGTGTTVAVDGSGNAFVTGVVHDPSFPTTSQNLGSCGTVCSTGFATKFDSTGKIVYSTLLGSGARARAMVVTSNGELLLAGAAGDPGLLTVNAYQPAGGGAFFAKLNATGTGYDFASYFGSPGTVAWGIAPDPTGNIYLAGIGSVPLVKPLQQDVGNLFVSEFSPDGKTLLASTLLGTTRYVAGIAAGTDGSVYVAGTTDLPDFPFTLNAARLPIISDGTQTVLQMFLTALKPGLTGLSFSTYVGMGSLNSITIDGSDRLYVAGSFGPEPLVLKNPVVSDLSSGGFVSSYDKTGQLLFASQYGGHNVAQVPTSIAVDGSGNIYIAGVPYKDATNSQGDIVDPVNVGTGNSYSQQGLLGPYVTSYSFNTFAAKVAPASRPQISLSYAGPYLSLRDAGSADLHISSITSGGAPLTAGNCTSTIPAGTSCILNTPNTVVINSDAQPSTQSFTPANVVNSLPLFVQPRKLYFGPQQVGVPSLPHPIKITNLLTTSQAVPYINAQGEITQTNDCPVSLDPGASCTISVTWTPSNASQSSTISFGGIVVYIRTPNYPSLTPLALSMAGSYLGSVNVGQSSLARTVNITNATNTSLPAPALSLSGSSTFSITGTTCNAPLAPEASCAVSVQFTPTANGKVTADLSVSSGSGASTASFAAVGKMPSTVAANPLELSFYNAVVGQASYPQPVVLTNNGTSNVTVTGITFSLPDYSETDTCQNPIPPSGTCTITVTATPQDVGDRTASMTVSFDSAQAQVLPLHMQAEYPIGSNVSVLDFGNVTPLGTDSNPQNIILTNMVQYSPVEYAIAVTGDFKFTSYCPPSPMPAYTGCSVQVIFHPLTEGPQEGKMILSFPGISQQEVITLKGATSSPGIAVSPNNLSFGSVYATLTSNPQQITLTNPQSFAVSVPAPSLGGTGASQFQVTDNCGTIQPGSSCNVSVVFAPTLAGDQSATLTFQNGGTPPNDIPVTLSGTGLGVQGFSTTVSTLYFGDVNLGSSGQNLLKLTNYGPHPAPLPALTLSGAAATEFTATPEAGCSMVPEFGGSCNVSIVFTPKAAGTRSAVLSFQSGATVPRTVELTMWGSGADFAFAPIGSTTKTIASGQSAMFNLGISVTGFPSGTATITCQAVGVSYGPCTANPQSIAINSDSTTTITISKAQTAQAHPEKSPWSRTVLYVFLIGPVGLLLRRKSRALVSTCMLTIATLVLLVSCGGGGSSTPPPPQSQTYTYTVTATAPGNLVHTTTLTLVVTSR